MRFYDDIRKLVAVSLLWVGFALVALGASVVLYFKPQ